MKNTTAKIEKYVAPIHWTSDLVELRINVNKGEGFRMRSELRIGVDSFDSAIKLMDWLRRRNIDCNRGLSSNCAENPAKAEIKREQGFHTKSKG
jgi:hypothetical protein